jgi:hypothetical protein
MAAVFMSGHFHLLLSVNDANQLAEFMRYLNTNLSFEINRLYDRRGAVWGSRYKAILVSQEEAALLKDRLTLFPGPTTSGQGSAAKSSSG